MFGIFQNLTIFYNAVLSLRNLTEIETDKEVIALLQSGGGGGGNFTAPSPCCFLPNSSQTVNTVTF